MMKWILAILVASFGANANSSMLYTYVGPSYIEIHDGPTPGAYSTAMHVEIRLRFASAISPNTDLDFGVEHLFLSTSPPEFWSVSDGRHYWDSNISGPFDNNPPWVPRFDFARLSTDANGDISTWLINFAVHNYYPVEHPVPLVHRIYSEFPPRNPESPAALHDAAQVSIAVDPSTGEFDDEAFTNQSGTWQMTQVVPVPSAVWLLVSGLPLTIVGIIRPRRPT